MTVHFIEMRCVRYEDLGCDGTMYPTGLRHVTVESDENIKVLGSSTGMLCDKCGQKAYPVFAEAVATFR